MASSSTFSLTPGRKVGVRPGKKRLTTPAAKCMRELGRRKAATHVARKSARPEKKRTKTADGGSGACSDKKKRQKKKKSARPQDLHSAVVDCVVYPSIIRTKMGVEAAIAMRALVTATVDSRRPRGVRGESRLSEKAGDGVCRAFSATWLSKLLNYGIDECVVLLDAFERLGYIYSVYKFEQKAGVALADFDLSHTIVYKLVNSTTLIDADVELKDGVPKGRAASISSAKELDVFVANKRAVRFVQGVVETLKRRGLVLFST